MAYLSRYTHRVAIANSRLIAHDDRGVTFKWKDYRCKGRTRQKTMTLATDEFIRRFLLHVLPNGFHRIRHYGLFANTVRADNLLHARELLESGATENLVAQETESKPSPSPTFVCPSCAAPMIIIDILTRQHPPRAPPKRLE